MRWIVVLLLVGACGFHSPPAGLDAPLPAWWDPAWPFRMRIVIDNAMPLPQDFQIGLPRDLDVAPCDGSRDAVRVVRNHLTDLPRVIDELGGDEWIWFRLAAPVAASVGPSEYWLYCGNPGAGPAPSDPAAVFDAYDSFEGTSLSAAWAQQGTVTVANGGVTVGGSNSGIHSTKAYGAGTATDFIMQASSAALGNPWFWGGFEIAFTLTAPWVIWHSHAANMIWQEENRTGQNPTAMGSRSLDTAAHLYGVEHYGTSAGFRYGNVPVGSLPYGGMISPAMHVRLHNYQSSGTVEFQMARVRKAVNPIPMVTVGEVEHEP